MRKTKGGCRKVKVLGVTTLLTFTFFHFAVSAQESINATGGNATGSGGSVSYSIGQVAYQTHTGTNGSVVEGVQQPFEISVVTAIEEAIGITFNISAYPNPAKQFLTLEIKDFDPTGLTCQLFDMSGKMLDYVKIADTLMSIDLSGLVPAIYFVRVVQNNNEIKTFKIIKN